jgi:hypothetical protein
MNRNNDVFFSCPFWMVTGCSDQSDKSDPSDQSDQSDRSDRSVK